MNMTNCYFETIDSELNSLIEEWNFDNFNSTKLVQPGVYDDSLTLNDIDYVLEHISVY